MKTLAKTTSAVTNNGWLLLLAENNFSLINGKLISTKAAVSSPELSYEGSEYDLGTQAELNY